LLPIKEASRGMLAWASLHTTPQGSWEVEIWHCQRALKTENAGKTSEELLDDDDSEENDCIASLPDVPEVA